MGSERTSPSAAEHFKRERPFGLLISLIYLSAALISLGNSLVSTWFFRSVLGGFPELPALPFQSLPLRVLLWLFLEASLAYIFGWAMARLFTPGRGFPVVILAAAGLLAGWTSLLNIQWIMLQSRPHTLQQHALFLGAACGALWMGLYFLGIHWDRLCRQRVDGGSPRFPHALRRKRRTLLWVRVICFGAAYAAIMGLGGSGAGKEPVGAQPRSVQIFLDRG